MTEDIEALHYNTAIAALMELINVLRTESGYDKSVMEDLVVMLAPFAPHFAEECWERLGHDTSVFEARWPEWDERLVVEDQDRSPLAWQGGQLSRVIAELAASAV